MSCELKSQKYVPWEDEELMNAAGGSFVTAEVDAWYANVQADTPEYYAVRAVFCALGVNCSPETAETWISQSKEHWAKAIELGW